MILTAFYKEYISDKLKKADTELKTKRKIDLIENAQKEGKKRRKLKDILLILCNAKTLISSPLGNGQGNKHCLNSDRKSLERASEAFIDKGV